MTVKKHGMEASSCPWLRCRGKESHCVPVSVGRLVVVAVERRQELRFARLLWTTLSTAFRLIYVVSSTPCPRDTNL
jgi:hypothetical protein